MIESPESVLSSAQDFLSRFLDPARAHQRGAFVRELRPHDDDWAKVFRPPVDAELRQAYQSLWVNPPDVGPKAGQTELRLTYAMAEELGTGSERARGFPGGFADLRPHLVPGFFWIGWRWTAPHETGGLSFHGLVHMGGGRFAWFPKPWRMLGGGKTGGAN